MINIVILRLVKNPYCNGIRSYSPKQFQFGLPPLLILSLENLQTKHLSNIPVEFGLPNSEKRYA